MTIADCGLRIADLRHKRPRIADLLDEADQILSMVIASIKTAKRLQANPQSAIRNQKSYA
jgi:hypothetical protein